ncbi:MAG: cation:proton antiporter [Dehalococcoidia bacterium]|jgi:cell volume regulation protein A
MSAVQIIGFIGILVAIGFLADYLFRKISFPDIIILLALGYLIGPVFGIIDPAQIAPASQIIASLALVVILFNGGLDLKFSAVLSSAPRALVLVIVGIVASAAGVAFLAHHLLGWDLMHCILLGAIVSGTSPSIVMPLVKRAKAPGKVASVLNLESAFDGALVIVLALVVLQVITRGQTGDEATMIGQAIAIKFSIGIGVGAAVGVAWLWVLTLIEGEIFDDILTLAIVFIFYFIVEGIGGSGVMFALVFGLILGNGVEVAHFLRLKRTVEIHDMMKKFHSQMSFLIKTFFFVYLGLMLSFDKPDLIIFGVVISFAMLFIRYIVSLLASIGSRVMFRSSGFLATMLPRGLSAAVVAEIVVAAGIANADAYPDIIMVVIVATVIIAAIGIPIFARKAPEEKTGLQVPLPLGEKAEKEKKSLEE